MNEGERSAGPERRAAATMQALARYRERRALDGAGVSCLLERMDVAEEDADHHRRRSELVRRAVAESGLPHWLAEQVYDVAREEGLEPAFAFELVHCRVAVCGPEGAPPDAPMSVVGDPNWLGTPPPPTDAERERRLRTSFRRLRSLIDRCDSAEEAVVAFAREPDVAECGY